MERKAGGDMEDSVREESTGGGGGGGGRQKEVEEEVGGRKAGEESTSFFSHLGTDAGTKPRRRRTPFHQPDGQPNRHWHSGR